MHIQNTPNRHDEGLGAHDIHDKCTFEDAPSSESETDTVRVQVDEFVNIVIELNSVL